MCESWIDYLCNECRARLEGFNKARFAIEKITRHELTAEEEQALFNEFEPCEECKKALKEQALWTD